MLHNGLGPVDFRCHQGLTFRHSDDSTFAIMPITLTNALILNLDPPGAALGTIRIEADTITEVGAGAGAGRDGETLDCRGAVVMPGLVNGHTHLYSALATGMPPPAQAPANFHEILQRVWWRLDRALDAASIEVSAAVGALDALHCGTTTLIDHHASPDCIAGSLDQIERGIDSVGLRAVLCYETTDRNGADGAAAGLQENRRYIERCAQRKGGRFAAMVGAHAPFTLSDSSLAACADLAAEFKTGVHIHVAEDLCDDRICRDAYGAPLVQRLQACGILDGDRGIGAASIFAHGTQFEPDEAARISAQVAAVAHNPRSNMNNRVGYTSVAAMSNVLLGTDGIGSDMFTEARHAWFKACDAKAEVAPADVIGMLAHSAAVAGTRLGRKLGRLVPGAAADVVVTDYRPATPLNDANTPGHFLFALGPQHVRHVLVAGQWALRDNAPTRCDEQALRSRAVHVAQELWSRMQSL